MDGLIVDLLDSDEEQPPVKTSAPEPVNPIPPTVSEASNSSPIKNLPPVNRPGPLSVKLKMGVPVGDQTPPAKSPVNNENGKQKNKVLSMLMDPSSKFLADFDPEHSIRERRKMARKGGSITPIANGKPGTLYDDHGIHRETVLDVCDCLDMTCPGCHFPCPSCKSNKCGQACRVNRKYVYEGLLFDGKNHEVKNRLLNRGK